MPDWLRDVLAAIVSNAVMTVGIIAVMLAVGWVVHRLWGNRGLAWLLGKTEDEVRRMRRPRVVLGRLK